MLTYFDRVSFSTPTTGTGTITVGAALAGKVTPAGATVPNGSIVTLLIVDGSAWEISQSVYASAGTTLTRALKKSSTGSLLVLSGNAVCALVEDAEAINSFTQNLAFDSVAAVAASKIPSVVTFIVTKGYYAPGDLGGGRYVQASAGAGPGKIQSADGQWWVLVPNELGLVNPRQFGAKGDGVYGGVLWTGTNDTTALQNFFDYGKSLWISNGNFLTTGNVIGNAGGVSLHISGLGTTLSVVCSNAAAGDILVCAAGASVADLLFEGWAVEGKGVTGNTANGVMFPTSLAYSFDSTFRRFRVDKVGGHGVKDALNGGGSGFFSVLFDSCTGNSGKNLFDIDGGPSVTFLNTYPDSDSATGAAFRVHSGYPLFLGCNGVNGAHSWGVFGDVVAEDGVFQYCKPTFIGCNVEDFIVEGIRCKTSGLVWINSRCLAAHANVKGFNFDLNISDPGWIDNTNSFLTEGAGSWLDGVPIHFNGVGLLPFFKVGGPLASFRDDANTLTVAVYPGEPQARLAFQTWGPNVPTQTVASGIVASTTHTLAGATALTAQFNYISTANSNDAVKIQAAIGGLAPQWVFNQTANPVLVFPGLAGDQINGAGAGASKTLAAGAAAQFSFATDTLATAYLMGAAL